MNLAILWQRFGPYHLARLEGAARHFPEVVGIEVAGRDHYAWEMSGKCPPLARRTLFPDRNYESLKSSEIRTALSLELSRINPDAVAINGWAVPEAIAALRWCRRNKRRAIVMSETFLPSGNPLKEWVKRRRVAQFDAALVGGRWHAGYLVELGFPGERIRTGYDVVDNKHFTRGAEVARQKKDRWRRELGLPEHYFFANTRFLARKNIDGLLRAYASLGDGAGDWQLVISGSGEMEWAWKDLARDLGLENQVHWPGFVQYNQLPIYYGLAGCFVHPAHAEAWGLVINEAGAAGLPVIAGDRVGATCELVQSGVTGSVIDSSRVETLREAMAFIAALGDRERVEMGRSARKAVERYSPSHFGRMLRLLSELK